MTNGDQSAVAISANNVVCEGGKVLIQLQPAVIHLSSIKNNLMSLPSTAFHRIEEAELAWATVCNKLRY